MRLPPTLVMLASLAALTPLPAQTVRAPEWAVAVFPSGAEFDLEIAADDSSRALGYMYREHVGPRDGMLFLFPDTGRHTMWMKNCKVALDLIWLDASGRVVEIAHDQPPCPAEGPCRGVWPSRPARYVLEVAGGRSGAEGLKTGDRVAILSEPPLF